MPANKARFYAVKLGKKCLIRNILLLKNVYEIEFTDK